MTKIEMNIPVNWFEKHKEQLRKEYIEYEEKFNETPEDDQMNYRLVLDIDEDSESNFEEGRLRITGLNQASEIWVAIEDVHLNHNILTSVFEWVAKMANKFRTLLQALPKEGE